MNKPTQERKTKYMGIIEFCKKFLNHEITPMQEEIFKELDKGPRKMSIMFPRRIGRRLGSVVFENMDPIEFNLDEARMGQSKVRWMTREEIVKEFGGKGL